MPDLTSIISKPVRNEGEPSFLGSVFNTIDYPRQELFEKVLFGHGKRFGRDVTGGFASGLALDILLDPLNLVPGVGFIKYGGKATKAAKLANVGVREYSAIQQLRKLAPVFEPARESLRSSTLSFLETTDKLADLKGISKLKARKEIINTFKKGTPLSETFLGRKFDETFGIAKPTGEFAEGKVTRRLRRLGEIGVPGAGIAADFSKGISSKLVKTKADPRLLGVQEAKNFTRRQAEIAGDKAVKELDGKINYILKNNPGMTRKEAGKNILDVAELKQVDPDELLSSELSDVFLSAQSNLPEAKILGPDGKPINLGEELINQLDRVLTSKGLDSQKKLDIMTGLVESGHIDKATKEYLGRSIKSANDHYVLRAERLDRLKNELAPGVQEAATFMAQKNEELLKQGLQLGLPLTKFDGPDLNYIFHRITIEGKESLQNKEIREKFQAFASASIGPAKKRTIRDKTIEEVNEHMGFEFFSDDPLKLLLDRYYFSGQGQANLLHAEAAVDLFAKPYIGRKRPRDHTSLAKFFKDAGITRYRDVSWKPGIKRDELKTLLKEHGYNRISVPNATIKEMGLFQEYTRNGPALTKFLKNYDRYNSIMRFWVTSPIPAYHVRNALGNFFNGGILGGAHDLRDWAEGTRLSYKFHHGKALGDTDRKIINETLAQGVIGRSGLTYETRNALAGVQSDLLTGGKTFRNATLKLGEFIEDSGRLAVYLNQRKKGASIREAVAHVKKYLFDYENGLTAFEKGIGKRLSFFYTFTRFNIPLQLEQLISAKGLYKLDTVGKVTGFQRRQQNELDRPDYFNRLDTIDLPFGDFVINMGFPSEDLSTSLSPKFLLSQLPPQMKVPWELIYEKDSFTGADINKLDRSNTLGKMILGTGSQSMIDLFGAKRLKGGGYRIHPWIDKIIDATPATRFKGILDKLFDDSLPEKDRVTQGILSFMVGSIKNLDQAKKTEFRRRTSKFFREQERAGDVRSFTRYFGLTPQGKRSVREQP